MERGSEVKGLREEVLVGEDTHKCWNQTLKQNGQLAQAASRGGRGEESNCPWGTPMRALESASLPQETCSACIPRN